MRWLALVLLIGCGDNLAGLTLDQRQAAETAARCEQLTRCGLVDDAAACVAATRARNEIVLRAVIAAGVIQYSSVNETICLEDLANISCDRTSKSYRSSPISCQGALLGTRASNAPCTFDEECASGRCEEAICEPYECCMGSCKPSRKATGECMQNDDCVETAYCSAEHQCKALEKELADCPSDQACVFGLACIGASSVQPGTCRKLPKIGEACPYNRCADIGARCDSTTNKCVALGLNGASCTGDSDCAPFFQCGAGATCEHLPMLGEPCVTRCAGDAVCSLNLCKPPFEDNSPCGSNTDCANGLCVEGPLFYQCITPPVCL